MPSAHVGPDGGSLKKALDYLLPYIGPGREAWPGNQHRAITSRDIDFALAVADRVRPGEGYGKRLG